MKLYTDYTGKFQMYIPIEWEYKNPSLYEKVVEGTPQAFGLYDSLLGAFQLSCKPINEHISELIKTRHEPIQSSDSVKLIFSEFKNDMGDKTIFVFSCAVDDHYFLATYIIPIGSISKDEYKAEMANVKKTLSTVKFIKPDFRNHLITKRRFDLFMSSIAATIDLKNKSIENGSFIEYVVLAANKIDALLRLSIILTNQINNKNDEIDTTFLFQNEGDKPLMERTIYKIVFDKGILEQIFFDELEDLYKQRNKVIHRYIITDIRTTDVVKIAIRYGTLEEKIDLIVNNLEKKQSELKIGIYANSKDLGKGFNEIEMKELLTKIRDKHGKVNWDIFEKKNNK